MDDSSDPRGIARRFHETRAEERPTHIGPYKIREVLGERGMGVVYLAEQEKPIHRRVALKIIKLGMDTKQVIARFETEREALALMNHPNVAKVFDAGVTKSGPPPEGPATARICSSAPVDIQTGLVRSHFDS
jgi:serine/threonine protein kinase